MKYKSIYFVATESIKNLGNFRNYLIENTEHLVTFHFPHGYLRKASYLEIYEKGKKISRKEFFQYNGSNNIFKLLFYYLYFNYIIFKFVSRNSFVIVENPIFCIFNSISSAFKNLKFVFWVGDYFPNHKGFMWFYNKIADYYNKHLSYVMYVSPPLYTHYMSQLSPHDKKTKHRAEFSLGIKRRSMEKRTLHKNIVMGFIGVIREKQGMELAFEYLKTSSNVFLEIIGDGYSLPFYKVLARKYGIEDKITFYGFVEDINPIIKTWDIGLALYKNSKDNVSKYCEPVKIKNYLEYGMPVITTKTTYFASVLTKYHAGVVITEKPQRLHDAIVKIKKNYKTYEKGVRTIQETYEYKKLYDKTFSFLSE